MSSRSARLRRPLALLGVFTASCLVHAGALTGGFNWLDHGDVEERRAILEPAELHRAFATPFGTTGFYRPLVTVTLSIDRAIHGDAAWGFHLTNVLLAGLVAAASLLLLRSFFELDRAAALAGAAVIAVHPLTWLPAGAIAYRPELLVTLFAVLSLTLYVRARRAGRAPWGAAAAFFAALMSKETALVWVPPLLVLWELARADGGSAGPSDRPWRARLRAALPALSGMAAVAAVSLAARVSAVPGGWGLEGPGLALSPALGTRLAALGRRLADLVALEPPGLSDATAVVPLHHPSSLATLTLVGVAIAIVARLGLTHRLSRPLLFLAVALAPALNVLPLPRFSSPHYSYFALPALGAAIGLGWRRLRDRSRPLAVAATALVALWTATMAASTFAESFRFRSDVTLFEPEVARDPRFREGWHYLGVAAYERGDLESAARAFELALRDDPEVIAYVDTPSVLVDLAVTRMDQRRLRDADALLRRAAQVAPAEMQPIIAFDRALVAWRAGRGDLVRPLLGPLAADAPDLPPGELLEHARRRVSGSAR